MAPPPRDSDARRAGGASSVRIARAYDAAPYPSYAFDDTHPDRLRTVALLLGLTPPPVETCRVLEVGCASGGNLIPLAEQLPRAELVGLDLSRRQVDMARGTIEALGLTNVRVEVADLREVDDGWGRFDYIIAHGVVSWIPAPARHALLSLCADRLSDDGIAYLSYNARPGWSMRSVVRDVMQWHTRGVPQPRAKVEQGLGLMGALVKALGTQDHALANLLRDERELLLDYEPGAVLHDWLSEHNEPLWFHELTAEAMDRGLRYAGESRVSEMLPDILWPEARALLEDPRRDPLLTQQLRDILTGAGFRMSLFCRAGRTPSAELLRDGLRSLRVATSARSCDTATGADNPGGRAFALLRDFTVSTSDPLVMGALQALDVRWPRSMAFADLVEEARDRSAARSRPPSTALAGEVLVRELMRFYTHGALDVRSWEPGMVTRVSDRPRASAVARQQATQARKVPNLLHRMLTLPPVAHILLPYVDGTRDRDTLTDVLVDLEARGELRLPPPAPGAPPPPPGLVRTTLAQTVDQALALLARNALLMG
jgi:SAM-dependent methyltransferase